MISKEQLVKEFFAEVKTEKITIANVVSYIKQIDQRRIYLDYKCTSIFEFLTKHAGYSKSAAQRRIDAARLSRDLPEVAESLKTGEINLTQVSQISRLVREKEKTAKVDVKSKKQLLEAIKHKSTDATEVTLCQLLDIAPLQQDKTKIQADESVRHETTLSKEEEELFKHVKELMSHKNPNASFKEAVIEAFQIYVKVKDPAAKVSTAAAPRTASPRYIPAKTKTHLFQKQRHCQWRHKDGSTCGSRFRLEIDHIQPVYKGGTNAPKNLQLLCDTHNRQKYRDQRP